MSTRKNRGFKPPSARKFAVITYGRCDQEPCNKVRYGSRTDAKAMAKKLFPSDHMSAYRCGNYWHFGHPPKRVIAGHPWGDEDYLNRRANQVLEESTIEPVECNGCGELVAWTINQGYVHDCTVVGIDDQGESGT